MGAYQSASQLLPKPVLAMAREFNYSKENYLILARRNKQLQKDFPQIWENIQSCAYCADGRSSIEYARDLVASWLVEDYFLHLLTEAGCEATAAGADKRRAILQYCQTGADCDFQVRLNGQVCHVEFLCDYTGYWRRTGHVDLRDGKYKKLRAQQAQALGVDARQRQAILLDFRQEVPGVRRLEVHKPYGGKPAYVVPCPETGFFPLSPDELAKHLRSALLAKTA